MESLTLQVNDSGRHRPRRIALLSLKIIAQLMMLAIITMAVFHLGFKRGYERNNAEWLRALDARDERPARHSATPREYSV